MELTHKLLIFLVTIASIGPVLGQLCSVEEKTPISTHYDRTTTITCNWNRAKRTFTADTTDRTCELDFTVSRKQACCDGYYGTPESGCVPVCKAGCENGRCVAPETCTCNAGYSMVSGRCAPNCPNGGCANGVCVAPNQCVCSAGFVKNTAGKCIPRCADDCVNGVCNEQNQCECRDGFYFNEKLLDFGIRNNTVCTPKCDLPCIDGFCAGRNRCECLFGYQLSKEDQFKCEPVCDWVDCSEGECQGPNKCLCKAGYKMEQNRCVPECRKGCANGDCTGVEECTCWQGYEKSIESHVCVPRCDPPCENGDCVAINQCSCHAGYRNVGGRTCELLCESQYIDVQNGKCIAANVLRCDDGFKLQESDYKLSCVSKCSQACVNATCNSEGNCECLPGFQWSIGSSYICEPVCNMSTCLNAHCVAPNQCECDYGYRRTPENPELCTFYCDPAVIDCSPGNCTDVNTCDCPEGFEVQTDTDGIDRCLPLCNPTCKNAKCSDVHTCECLPGYQRVSATTCEPICNDPCDNGACTGPNTCRCNDGFIALNATSCIPFCAPDTVDCGKGDCIAPNDCQCYEGYAQQDINGTKRCEPVCEQLPINTICVAPGVYRCLDGHETGIDGHCGPICEQDCGENGTCSAPNTCFCNAGFAAEGNAPCSSICESKCSAEAGICEGLLCKCNLGYSNSESEYFCSPVCARCANGKCVAPDECQCDDGYARTNGSTICLPICSDCRSLSCCIAPEVCECEASAKTVAEPSSIVWVIVAVAIAGSVIFVSAAILLTKYIRKTHLSDSYECKYEHSSDRAAIVNSTDGSSSPKSGGSLQKIIRSSQTVRGTQ